MRETVKMYQKLMPGLSESISFDGISSKSEQELEEMLQEIRFVLGASNNVLFHQNLIEQGIGLIETFGPAFGFDLSGLSAETRMDPSFQQICQELVLASAEDGWEIMSPTNRLLFSIVGRILKKHDDNSRATIADRISNMIVDPEIVEKYRHL